MEDIETFLAIIEGGSQTATARRLGRSLQSVNRSLLALERRVGVELVRRTTRRATLEHKALEGLCSTSTFATPAAFSIP
ncbi:LysR family transcriptional regulator [Reyranella sp.]|uniref:LysR family transcriptional regulator n=1 Tax=Reyranella sp. TaxID=1929291 RepID=UPI0037852AB8